MGFQRIDDTLGNIGICALTEWRLALYMDFFGNCFYPGDPCSSTLRCSLLKVSVDVCGQCHNAIFGNHPDVGCAYAGFPGQFFLNVTLELDIGLLATNCSRCHHNSSSV